MDWIAVAEDRDRWRLLVNAVGDSGFRKMSGIPWLAEDLLVSYEGLYSMEKAVVRLFVNIRILDDGKYISL